MLVAVAACVLGLLPGIVSLAPAGSAVVQAAQPDQPHAAAPAGGLAAAVRSTGSGPKDYLPNLITQSTGAPDEQLNVAAALDQGTRLFLLQARYQDAGDGQADYYLAGPQGASHQPLRVLFAPLGTWLAAPGHEHEVVSLGLRTDPHSANPARFDAACQAFMSALGPYLLKSSDLPVGKSLEELTRDELAGAWRAQPRVITDWSACTGAEPPLARPHPKPAAAVPVQDHWMGDQKDIIGQRPLRQVVIPGSHDAASYDDSSCPAGQCWPGGPIEAMAAQAQSQDITAQLNAGSRYFDLRFSYSDLLVAGAKDFYVFHGTIGSGNDPDPILSFLKMSKVLGDIDTWINQPGHEREIVWLDMWVYREGYDPSQSKAICDATLGWELAQGKVLQSSTLPPNTALTDMSMNEIWALPGHPHIIVTGWSSCTGDNPMTKGGTWAARCWAQNIWDQLSPELLARQDSNRNLVTGAYTLAVQGTPYSVDTCWVPPYSVRYLAPQQNLPLTELKWLGDGPYWPNNMLARANLNVVAGDFLGDPAGEGPANWPIVQTALTLDQSSFPEALSWTTDLSASKPVTVSCNNPTIVGPTTMVVYPVVQGPQSPNVKTFTTGQGYPGVQGSVSLNDFPGAGAASDGSYLVAVCTRDGSPLAPPGSSNGVGMSRIVIPLSAFGTLPLLGATPADAVDLPFTCFGAGTQPIQVTAYPAAAGPNSPDAQVFVSANGQPTVQATYNRRGSYDVRLDCLMSGTTKSLTVPAGAFSPALTIRADQKDRWLYCDRNLQLKSSATLSLAAQTPNAPAPLSITGSDKTLILTVKPDYFPNGDYLLTATCASSDTPPFTAAPLTLSSSEVPRTLRATPSSGLQLAITSVNPQANGIRAVAYPASAGPDSPDAETFDAPVGQQTLQATYSRRSNYDVKVDWSLGGGSINTLTVPANAFPLPLTIRADRQDRWLYCDRDLQLMSSATLSLAAQTPNPPAPLSVTGSSKTLVLTVQPDYFPAGDYQLTATCLSGDAPPFTATPLTISSSQIPTRKGVTAEITGCSAQGGNAYTCTLQVTLGAPLAINTVFSVGIGGGGFANPSGADKPQVTYSSGCQNKPNPSPYYPGNGGYNRYDVNISTGGCTTGAMVTFGEAVTGAAKATITQPVTVPGLGASTATFVLPQAATRTGMAVP
jgi:hypothetical protein